MMAIQSSTLRNVAVTSRRNVANQRSYVIIIARKEGGAWELIIINAPHASFSACVIVQVRYYEEKHLAFTQYL